jgi:hypothetical protein
MYTSQSLAYTSTWYDGTGVMVYFSAAYASPASSALTLQRSDDNGVTWYDTYVKRLLTPKTKVLFEVAESSSNMGLMTQGQEPTMARRVYDEYNANGLWHITHQRYFSFAMPSDWSEATHTSLVVYAEGTFYNGYVLFSLSGPSGSGYPRITALYSDFGGVVSLSATLPAAGLVAGGGYGEYLLQLDNASNASLMTITRARVTVSYLPVIA